MNVCKFFALIAVLLIVFTSTASADLVPFQWSSSGSFSPVTLPAGLTFAGAPLSPVTNTNPAGLLNIDVGTFTLADITTDYTGTFTLTVDFFRPDGVFGSPVNVNSTTFVADADYNKALDRLTINFPVSTSYAFTGSDGTGTFNFGIHNVSDNRTDGQTDAIMLKGMIKQADIDAPAAVPEPSSILLLATMLVGATQLLRRKHT